MPTTGNFRTYSLTLALCAALAVPWEVLCSSASGHGETGQEEKSALDSAWFDMVDAAVEDARWDDEAMLKWCLAVVEKCEALPRTLEVTNAGDERRGFGIEFRDVEGHHAARLWSWGILPGESPGGVRLLHLSGFGPLSARTSGNRVFAELQISWGDQGLTMDGEVRRELAADDAAWVRSQLESLPAGIQFSFRGDAADVFECRWFLGRNDLTTGTVESWKQELQPPQQLIASTSRLRAAVRARAKRVVGGLRWD